MATLREKIQGKWDEGREAFTVMVRDRIGEAEMAGASLYSIDMTHRGRRLLLDLQSLSEDLGAFLELKADPNEEERAAHVQLHINDAIEAAIGREKAAAKAQRLSDEQPEPPPAPDEDLVAAQKELDEQLLRLDIRGAVFADVARRPEDGALVVDIGQAEGDESQRWQVQREVPRVLTALEQLEKLAGAGAIRAALCGLEPEAAVEQEAGATAEPERELPGRAIGEPPKKRSSQKKAKKTSPQARRLIVLEELDRVGLKSTFQRLNGDGSRCHLMSGVTSVSLPTAALLAILEEYSDSAMAWADICSQARDEQAGWVWEDTSKSWERPTTDVAAEVAP